MDRPHAILEDLARRGPLLTRQLAASTGLHADSARYILACLRKEGLVESAAGVHAITAQGREALERHALLPCQRKGRVRRDGSLRQKAWNLMRMRDSFTVDDLLLALCDGAEKSAVQNLTCYCRALRKAGFLGVSQRTHAFFLRRDKNGGRLAPAYNRVEKYVIDRNTGEIFNIEGERQCSEMS